jgi:hypothetical protein
MFEDRESVFAIDAIEALCNVLAPLHSGTRQAQKNASLMMKYKMVYVQVLQSGQFQMPMPAQHQTPNAV